MVRRLFGLGIKKKPKKPTKKRIVRKRKKLKPIRKKIIKKVKKKRAPRTKVKIENVVVSASLHKEIPLEAVARRLPNTEYNPEQFPGLVLRMNEEKGKRVTALVFSSGKIVCTGTKSEKEVPRAIRMIIKELAKAKIKITKKPDMQIQNMVASGDIGMTLNLNKLAFKLPTAEYEPEQFPGLVYKVPKSHITFLLFGTGRIVCTGAKNERQIRKAVRELVKTLNAIR